jgi:hypothetical protein
MSDAWQAGLVAIRSDAVFKDQMTTINAHTDSVSKECDYSMPGCGCGSQIRTGVIHS